MRLSTLMLAAVLMSAITLNAQNAAPQTPPQSGNSGMPESKCTCGMKGMGGMYGMHQQHMKEMQADLDKMHALLKDMQAKAESLSPKDKAAMMDNVQMWQMVVDRFDHMMKHMQEMQSGKCPMDKDHPMHHDGMMGEGEGQFNPSGNTAPPPAK